MSQPATPSDAKPASPRQVLLGLFILFQLAFLFLSNAIGYLKTAPGEMKDRPAELLNRVVPAVAEKSEREKHWLVQIESTLTLWGQLTGQHQEWSLFAPAISKATAFPCVMLLWDDTPPAIPGIKGAVVQFDRKNGYYIEFDDNAPRLDIVRSENEPADLNTYFRVGRCRLRRCEGDLFVHSQPYPRETRESAATRITEDVKTLRSRYPEFVLAYMKWQLHAWQREHPDAPTPKQIILAQRLYRTHDPDEAPGWDGPFLVPLLRWRPVDVPPTLDVFDFAEERFVR